MFKNYIAILSFFIFCLGAQLYAEQPDFNEKVYYTMEQAIETVFPEATAIEKVEVTITQDMRKSIEQRLGFKVAEEKITFYEGLKKGESMGYAIVLDEYGKYYPMTFMTAISADLKVQNIVLMVYREKVGAGVRKKRFLKQFFNKTSKDTLKVNNDIVGISGATISSWSIAMGVKKALVLTEELKVYL